MRERGGGRGVDGVDFSSPLFSPLESSTAWDGDPVIASGYPLSSLSAPPALTSLLIQSAP